MVNYYILTGSLENWETAISNSMWGVREGLKIRWNKINISDILFFYVKSPISGIIGVGKVTDKFQGKNQLWRDEIQENKIIYPYRFEFKILYVLPKPWKDKKISAIGLGIQAGLNPLRNKQSIEKIIVQIKEIWNIDLEKPKIKSEVKEISLHNSIKEKVQKIGEMKGLISESEYQISNSDRRLLDVVWRTPGVGGAVPKYIFEVEDQGEFYRALAKLKHCFDLWGFPKLFIIVKKEDIPKVNQLLEGTFHEIKENLKVLDMSQVNEMYEAEKRSFEAKQNTGLP